MQWWPGCWVLHDKRILGEERDALEDKLDIYCPVMAITRSYLYSASTSTFLHFHWQLNNLLIYYGVIYIYIYYNTVSAFILYDIVYLSYVYHLVIWILNEVFFTWPVTCFFCKERILFIKINWNCFSQINRLKWSTCFL